MCKGWVGLPGILWDVLLLSGHACCEKSGKPLRRITDQTELHMHTTKVCSC